jgi:hypothetical protein
MDIPPSLPRSESLLPLSFILSPPPPRNPPSPFLPPQQFPPRFFLLGRAACRRWRRTCVLASSAGPIHSSHFTYPRHPSPSSSAMSHTLALRGGPPATPRRVLPPAAGVNAALAGGPRASQRPAACPRPAGRECVRLGGRARGRPPRELPTLAVLPTRTAPPLHQAQRQWRAR